jgi:UPF0755 protein
MTDDEFEALLRPQNQQEKPATRADARPAPRHDDRAAHRRAVWGVLITVSLLLGALIGAGWWLWAQYGDSVRSFFGQEEIADYEGPGSDPEILITVEPGDIGEVVARKLHNDGVTASFESVYNILLIDSSIVFQPGTYRLLSEMSAEEAIAALRDPANRAEYRFTLPEGIRLVDALDIIAERTSLDRADLDRAVEDPARYGVTPPFGGLEGYLFPATYTFEWGTDAETIIGRLVDETIRRLDAKGVAPEDIHDILTIASILEREARVEDDFYKVSRVIYNRLAPGSGVPKLQMDSTVTYWEETFDTVWTTDAARANPDNPYNTYYYDGLPAGPIALSGDLALDAALNPAEGPWLFFVTWNMATGETLFSVSVAEHERYIALGKICRDNEDRRDECRSIQQ